MFLMSVSVHPAMAADAVNKELDCQTCGGMNDISSIPGFEGKKVPVVEIREFIINSGTNPDTASKHMHSAAASAAGTQLHRVGTVSLNVVDPRTETSATDKGKPSGTMQFPASVGSPGILPDWITANLSSEGYIFSSESGAHRYETDLESDDFLSLNSSQKDTLAAAGFTSVSSDTIRSYRDVTYYTFTNTATGNTVYVMAVQKLDADGNSICEPQYSVSPEFSQKSGASRSGTTRMATASTVDRNGSCFWNWVSVSLLAVALIIDIAIFLEVWASIGPVLVIDLGFVIWTSKDHGIEATLELEMTNFYIVGIAIGLVILILLAYAIYKLGVCMKWWDEISWDSIAWTYQERFGYADNGKNMPVALHDRIAVALPANTSADKNAAWIPDLSGAGGLVLKDNKVVTFDNGTIQSWLFEANKEGSQQPVFRYVTTAPVPSDIPATTFTLTLPVQPGNWKIVRVDDSASRYGTGLYASLAFDPAGTAHISYYDAGVGGIRYATLAGNVWVAETVAPSAGTYSTSLAFDKAGTPAISFGDGYHFGNLVFATKNGTTWETVTVAKGSAGDAGQDSSLAFDNNGVPHISYNDGQSFATLKFAARNRSTWEISTIDNENLVGDTGYGSSLKFDAGGFPRVVYTTGKSYANLMYAASNGSAWTNTKVDNGGGITKSTGFTPSLALDAKGFPHISYYEASNKDLRYASWNGTGWLTETVDSINDVGAFSSLAIGTNGQPHISYYDASNHELRYATKTGDFWIKRTIDNDGMVGQFSSLALDPAGHPCFAYFDDTHHALKYAGWVV